MWLKLYDLVTFEHWMQICVMFSNVRQTRISIQSIWIADYACVFKNKRGNVVDSI